MCTCVCEHVCAVPMEARKGIDPLEWELQVLEHPVWVLGTEFGKSSKSFKAPSSLLTFFLLLMYPRFA